MAVAPDNDSCAPLVAGGYDFDFVEPPPDSLQCPVCLLPFRDPNLLSCCGHKGCASCLGRIKAAGHPCPICQQPFDTMLEKAIQRKVLDLHVYCSEKRQGCRWEGELRCLQTHSQRDCDYIEEECRYKCGVRYQRRLLQDHEMEECPQRPPEVITQSLIRKMAERMDKLEAVHGKKVTELLSSMRAVEKAHQEDRTKLAAVEKAHQENQAKFSQQIQELQQENNSLQGEKLKMTRKIEELESQLQQGGDWQVMELMASLEAVTKKHDEDKAKLGEALAKLAAVNKSLQEDQTNIVIVEAKLAALEKTHQEDHEKHSHQIYEQKRANALLQDEKEKLVKKVDELEGKLVKNMDELEDQLQQHSAHLLSLVPANGPSWLIDDRGMLSSPYPPCQIIMPHFSQHKRFDDMWFSQPFYSAPGGYKLCLRVDANGKVDGAGTHVTVSVNLMKGENDDQLEWPFVHDVSFRILNWKRDDNHQMATVHFKDASEKSNGRVTLTERANTAYSWFNFLPHSSLGGDAARNIQYLNEDYLCLQVLKVELPK